MKFSNFFILVNPATYCFMLGFSSAYVLKGFYEGFDEFDKLVKIGDYK